MITSSVQESRLRFPDMPPGSSIGACSPWTGHVSGHGRLRCLCERRTCDSVPLRTDPATLPRITPASWSAPDRRSPPMCRRASDRPTERIIFPHQPGHAPGAGIDRTIFRGAVRRRKRHQDAAGRSTSHGFFPQPRDRRPAWTSMPPHPDTSLIGCPALSNTESATLSRRERIPVASRRV